MPVTFSFDSLQFSPRYGADVPLTTIIDAVAASGCPAIGIDHWSVGAHPEVDLSPVLDDAGLRCSHVSPLVVGAKGRDPIEQAVRLRDIAHAVGAPVCVAAVGNEAGDPTSASVVEVFGRCAEILGEADVRMALEFLPYSPLRNVADARTICEQVGWSSAGLLLDSWHVLVADQLTALAEVTAEEVALVQLNDARLPLVGSLEDETRNHRCLPGEGNLDLGSFIRALDAMGYDGPVASEVLSAKVRAAPVAEHAEGVLRAMTSAWAHALAAR